MYNPPLPDAVKKEHKNLLKIIRNGESVDGIETLGCRKDGSFVDIALTISPVRGADSEINAFAAVARDITQKKIAEKRISEFYSVISHELRTPLTSIRGALALISEEIVEPGSTEAAELIDIAQSSTSRLIRLINDILDLRKIEAGKFELNLVDIRSIDLIKSAVSYMQGFAEEKRVSLVAKVSDDYQVEGDLDRLTQVLSNLISNALKYAPEGSVVEVSAVKAQHAMRFMVSDSGPGIPAEYHSKLFGKFEQVDASDRRTKEGSGLGLAISKAIVEQHGGTITFESVPGVRTVFEFDIPLSNAHIFAAPFATSALTAQSSKTDKAEPMGFELDEQSISAKEDDQGIGSQIQTYQSVPALKPLRLVSSNADTTPTRTREKSATLESCSNLLNQKEGARSYSLSASRFGISGHFFPAFTEDELNSSIKRWPAPVRLEALSEMSAGSDTSITSAQSDMDDPNQGGSESRQHVSSPLRIPERGKKILIVEDDIELASLLRINLERQNYLCMIAQTLEHAKDLVASEAPDAVVLDLELPDGDGLSLLEQLPGTARSGAKTPVIVITGSDQAAKKGESSIVDWLQKPFHQGNLSEAVDRAFKTEGQRKKVMIIDDDPETKMAVTAELSQLEINFVETSDCIDISRFDEGPQLDLIVFRESCLQGAEATRAFRKLRGRWSDYVPIIIYSSSELNGYGQQTASVSISHHMPKPGLEANFLAKVENVLFSFLSQTVVPGGSRMP
jgi:signal transduction histidine kinase/DNA-binding response OmpR family regulator